MLAINIEVLQIANKPRDRLTMLTMLYIVDNRRIGGITNSNANAINGFGRIKSSPTLDKGLNRLVH